MFATFALSIVLQISMSMIRKWKEEKDFGGRIGIQIVIFIFGIWLMEIGLPLLNFSFMTGPDSTSNFKCLLAVAVFVGMVSTFRFATQPLLIIDWKSIIRIMFLITVIPFLIGGILYLVNDELFALSIEYGAMGISVGLILLQILMLVRAPWDVYSTHTHSLQDYYDNIRPHHLSLSRSHRIAEVYEEKNTK